MNRIGVFERVSKPRSSEPHNDRARRRFLAERGLRAAVMSWGTGHACCVADEASRWTRSRPKPHRSEGVTSRSRHKWDARDRR
jgi:hypothetical protein